MFGDKLSKLPLLSDKLNFGFEGNKDFPKGPDIPHEGIPWSELHLHGIVSEEVIHDDEEVTTIIKRFISKDKTITRSSWFKLNTSDYKKYMEMVDLDEIADELDDLSVELEMYECHHQDEFTEYIRAQIEFLKQEFNIVEVDVED